MTVLAFWLVTALPEQEAVRPWKVKKTRPEVFTTAPPPVHAPPACGKAAGETADGEAAVAVVGAIVVGVAERPTWRTAPGAAVRSRGVADRMRSAVQKLAASRSEEQTSELQSRQYLVCRLLLEKK